MDMLKKYGITPQDVVYEDPLPKDGKLPKDLTSKLIEYRGIFLTKEEFGNCCKVAKVLQSDAKLNAATDNSIAEYALKIWINAIKSFFGYEIKWTQLELKEEIRVAGFKDQMTTYACRFKKDRPLLFLLVGMDGKYTFLDEKQFDAFDHGPYSKPGI